MNETQRLRQDLDILTREVDALRRRRDSLRGRPYDVRSATTFESYSGSNPYPRYGIDRALPIRFYEFNDDGERVYHSYDVACSARSPRVWLPPWVDVHVAAQPDGTWRIVQWPSLLHGRCTQAPAGATWTGSIYDPCSSYLVPSGWVQVYGNANWGYPELWDTPQTYRNGDPVLLQIYNTSNLSPAQRKLLTMSADNGGRWCVIVEPCAGECPDPVPS
jgi:hypothetical protein